MWCCCCGWCWLLVVMVMVCGFCLCVSFMRRVGRMYVLLFLIGVLFYDLWVVFVVVLCCCLGLLG